MHVSGIGTYTTTFTLPPHASGEESTYLEIGSTNGGIAVVYVNGVKAAALNPRRHADRDLRLIKPGDNRLVVEVASTLTNRMLQRGYETQGPYQDYGISGDLSIVAYEATATALAAPES